MNHKHTFFGALGLVALLIAFLPVSVTSQVFPGVSLYGRFSSAAKALVATTDGYLEVQVASGSTPTFESLTLTKNALVTTTAIGLKLQNTTAATVGVPVQVSPAEQLCGTAWKSNVTAASQIDCWQVYNVPATGAAATTQTLKWQSSINGVAYSDVMTLTSAGLLTISGTGVVATSLFPNTSIVFGSGTSTIFTNTADGKPNLTNNAASAGAGFDVTTDALLKIRTRAQTGYADIGLDKILYYGSDATGGIATVGWGVPAVYGYGDVAAATDTGTASIATYTVGAADGTFEVGCNVLVTTSTTHSFSCDVTYTDESNVARTLVLPVAQLAGSFVASGLITNVTGAGPYESPTMTIRAKAATAITVRTSAGGTYTTVVYNARGVIKQVA